MALPRKDRIGVRRGNHLLYSYDNVTKEPRRAFWHPSGGLWQLDDASENPDVIKLDHASRAHVVTAGKVAAKMLLTHLCGDAGITQMSLTDAFKPWGGCHPEIDRVVVQQCRDEYYPQIYIAATADRPEALHVDDESDGNATRFSLNGGLTELECRWGTSGKPFACWFYDTDHPEGFIADWDPRAELGGGDAVRSPLAAPFMSFTHGVDDDRQRFAVFPHSFLSGTDTLIKAVPVGARVRLWDPDSDEVDADFDPDGDEDPDHSWEVGTYGSQTLYVNVCFAGRVEFATDVCSWVSVNASDTDPLGSFSTRIRGAGH